ncbi:hypothetical protein M107_3593 [Bacteroides fragilis str. 3725 D9(v)]|nr:hypothetical protein M107_3593 [Bacteroides fragilis str. 3725 D9(v)]
MVSLVEFNEPSQHNGSKPYIPLFKEFERFPFFRYKIYKRDLYT